MVRTISQHLVPSEDGNLYYRELSGLHDDEKPSGLSTGSVFVEVDTGDVYLYDEVDEQWNKVGGSDE